MIYSTSSSYRVGDWEVIPDLHRLRRGQQVQEIEPRVMAVLEELAREPGRVVSRDDFHRTVWRDVIVSDDALNRCITRLRRHFGDDARAPRFIETISKSGYRLIARVVRDSQGASSAGLAVSGEPDDATREASEDAIVGTTLLGHRAEVVLRLDGDRWHDTVRDVAHTLGSSTRTIVLRRENVVLSAIADEQRTRFDLRTRTAAAAAPVATSLLAFLLATMLLYGWTFQAGHAGALSVMAALAGWFAGAPARRRALDRSLDAIEAFARVVRRACGDGPRGEG